MNNDEALRYFQDERGAIEQSREDNEIKKTLVSLLDALDDQFGPPNKGRFPVGTFEYVLDDERIRARELVSA